MMRTLGQIIGITVGAAILAFATVASWILKTNTAINNLTTAIRKSLYPAFSSVKEGFIAIYNYVVGIYSYVALISSKISSGIYSAISGVRSAFWSIYSYATSIYSYLSAISRLSFGNIKFFGSKGGVHGGVFQSGGVIPGSSYHGDKVNASLNSGEMVLNRSQQGALFNYIKNMNRPNVSFGSVNFAGDRGQMQQENVFTNLLLGAI